MTIRTLHRIRHLHAVARWRSERGTPLIFEVRGHDIDVSLRHCEKMARLEFYRMSEDSEAESGTGDYGDQATSTRIRIPARDFVKPETACAF